MTELAGDRLGDWISTVENDSLTALVSFARNLCRDLEAVRNGLSLPYSSGAVEGHVNRVKMLKRQMFGRANFNLSPEAHATAELKSHGLRQSQCA
ncbi:transposase [Actinomadura sp. NTSP31]|uniref:transposase n=1 Tax=Actinomadura sp. NTSP31 TaxID=1735447 RepID=UPI0035C1358C